MLETIRSIVWPPDRARFVDGSGRGHAVVTALSTLADGGGGDFIYTVSGEHFVRTAVRVGMLNPKFGEVTDGLYAGDKVVVTPLMTLWLAELQAIQGGKAYADGR